MIARLTFEWAGEPCVAELSDDLEWSCEGGPHASDVARYLDQLFNPRGGLTPSRGQPGYAQVQAAAEWLEATVEGLREPEGTNDGHCY